MRRDLGVMILDKDNIFMFYAEYEGDNLKRDSTSYSKLLIQPSKQTEPTPATDKDMNDYAVFLNSPWSQDNMHYEIKLNCKDAYTDMDPDAPQWRCLYSIVGYNGLFTSILGYGDTPNEALEDCIAIKAHIQDKFNPDDESC